MEIIKLILEHPVATCFIILAFGMAGEAIVGSFSKKPPSKV